MTDRTHPEALMQLADAYAEASFDQGLHKRTLDDAPENARSVLAAAVRSQHARIAELEAQLEAIGAGGVSGPLVGSAAPPTAQAEGWRPIETAPKGECVLLWSEITRGEPFIGDWAEYARYNHPKFTHWSRWDGLPPTSAEGLSMGDRSNPNNCASCRHKQNPDGGHCYMFRFEPAEMCAQHTSQIHALRMQAAPKAAPGEQFDSEEFRAWVLQNLPDDTIIGSSAWWADHLTTWAQRFMTPAPQQEAQEPCGWTTGITWRPDTRLQSEQVIKITRDTQPKYGYTTPIYTAPPPAPLSDDVAKDAALWHWLAEYLVGTRTDLDDEIVASKTVNDLRKLVEAAIKQGGKA